MPSMRQVVSRGARTSIVGRACSRGYRPLPGVADELLDADGQGAAGLARRSSTISRGCRRRSCRGASTQGDQYLRDAGVFFRQYGEDGSTERAWPLSHMPVLIHESEWSDDLATG